MGFAMQHLGVAEVACKLWHPPCPPPPSAESQPSALPSCLAAWGSASWGSALLIQLPCFGGGVFFVCFGHTQARKHLTYSRYQGKSFVKGVSLKKK